MKTAELTGAAIDWAVAKCEGHTPRYQRHFVTLDAPRYCADWDTAEEYSPSTDWSQGGPIIEREEICIKRQLPCSAGYEWNAWIWTKHIAKGGSSAGGSGPTPLIAAMRCYVASKLGDEVDVPEELK